MFEPTVKQLHKGTRLRPLLQSQSGKMRRLLLPFDDDKAYLTKMAQYIGGLVESVLSDNCHGWRTGHSVQTAVAHIESLEGERWGGDIENYFANIQQKRLKANLNKLDSALWPKLAPWLPSHGLSMGVNFSPALANLYLASFDRRWPCMVRYADNIMLIGGAPPYQMTNELRNMGLTLRTVSPLTFCNQQLHPSTPKVDDQGPIEYQVPLNGFGPQASPPSLGSTVERDTSLHSVATTL